MAGFGIRAQNARTPYLVLERFNHTKGLRPWQTKAKTKQNKIKSRKTKQNRKHKYNWKSPINQKPILLAQRIEMEYIYKEYIRINTVNLKQLIIFCRINPFKILYTHKIITSDDKIPFCMKRCNFVFAKRYAFRPRYLLNIHCDYIFLFVCIPFIVQR